MTTNIKHLHCVSILTYSPLSLKGNFLRGGKHTLDLDTYKSRSPMAIFAHYLSLTKQLNHIGTFDAMTLKQI